jgi:hypothetical protein
MHRLAAALRMVVDWLLQVGLLEGEAEANVRGPLHFLGKKAIVFAVGFGTGSDSGLAVQTLVVIPPWLWVLLGLRQLAGV